MTPSRTSRPFCLFFLVASNAETPAATHTHTHCQQLNTHTFTQHKPIVSSDYNKDEAFIHKHTTGSLIFMRTPGSLLFYFSLLLLFA